MGTNRILYGFVRGSSLTLTLALSLCHVALSFFVFTFFALHSGVYSRVRSFHTGLFLPSWVFPKALASLFVESNYPPPIAIQLQSKHMRCEM